LAAAALYALDHNVERLAEDHANADFLATGLKRLGLAVVPPQTNVVYVDVPAVHVAGLREHLKSRGIIATVGPRTRIVTHLDVSRADAQVVLLAFADYDWTAGIHE
jgi:threonine aldolase